MKCKMDDFDSGILSQAKNEYAARLVTILSPLVLEGIRSIYSEAVTLCKENDEDEKYLMTFQNFLSRIIKWNQTIISNETTRIIQKSGCNYLEDLLTCVHIAQLKILTSVRVGQKQKKIDIDIPKLDAFVHKVYIFLARKIYKNVYLYEKHVSPLEFQKNMREAEIMCKESILEVIRDSVPVEKILRAYIDETVDEEIIEKTEEILTEDTSDKTVETETEEKSTSEDDSNKIVIKKEQDTSSKKPEPVKENVVESVVNDLKNELVAEAKTATENSPTTSIAPTTPAGPETSKPELSIKTEPSQTKTTDNSQKAETTPELDVPLTPKTRARLTFNNTDSVLDMGTNQVKKVEAPKTVERLEHISNIRNEQRKIEEAEEEDDYEDEKLTIGTSIDLNKDILGIENINDGIELNAPVLSGIEVLK
jgi:hypothetical protein